MYLCRVHTPISPRFTGHAQQKTWTPLRWNSMSSLPPLLTMSEQSSVDKSGTSCSRAWSYTTSPPTQSICSRLEPSTTTVPGSGVTSARYCLHSFLNFFYYLGFLILKNYWRGPCMYTCTHMHVTCEHGCQRRTTCKSQSQLLSRGF